MAVAGINGHVNVSEFFQQAELASEASDVADMAEDFVPARVPTSGLMRSSDLAIANEIETALAEDRLRLMLQPIVAARTGETKFYEALIRLERRDGSLVAASQFVQAAERLGLHRQIDVRALEIAVDILRAAPALRLSLNVSGLTCGDAVWLARLRELSGGDPQLAGRLIVEITETAAIRDFDQSILFVDALKEFGCAVAIDDFGAGYSSFKTLKYLPVDLLKIDGLFVRNLASDPRDRVFLRAMVELANSFGMETVAEWVVSAEAAQVAADVGITYLQGYHFGCPLEVSEVIGNGSAL
jgi:EAL domain-containing protein (putative c-di-GMP-specific phosphodiesterase class I)